MPKIDGDEYGPNNTEPLETGRWMNGIKLDAAQNTKIVADAAKSGKVIRDTEQRLKDRGKAT